MFYWDCGAGPRLLPPPVAAGTGVRGFRPRATYFSPAGKVGKSALKGEHPVYSVDLIVLPLKNPRFYAWISAKSLRGIHGMVFMILRLLH